MKIIVSVGHLVRHYSLLLPFFFCGMGLLQAQEREIQGIVTADEFPLMNVAVQIQGVNQGTTTNIDGEYRINVQVGDTLTFSHLGYKTRQILITNQSQLDVELEPDATSLGAVEITGGYYSLNERTKTGHVAVVGRDQLDQQVIHSPLEALQGRVAGLEIETRTGLPGQAQMVTLRGQGSLKSFADYPLYIIDGVPISNEAFNSLSSMYDGAIGIDPLSTLDPALIESIEVLKDADATAIYGSRGANGVIIINTKRGEVGKTKFELQAETGVSWVKKYMDLMNTEQYLELRREAFENDGIEPTAATAPDLLLWDQNRYTDWQKELIGHHANFQKYQASVSGGNSQTSFLLSGGFKKEGTIFPRDFGFQSNNLLVNLNHKSRDNRFHLNTSINYGYRKSNLGNVGNLVHNGIFLAPNTPKLFNSNEDINWELDEFGNPTFINPVSGFINPNTMRMQSWQWNGTIDYRLIKGLTAKLNIGFHEINQDDIQINLRESFNPTFPETVRRTTTNHRFSYRKTILLEPQLQYIFTKGSHRFNSLFGSTFEKNNNQLLNLRGQGYFSDTQAENLALADDKLILSDESIDYRYAAVFARMGYSFADKYFLNLTGRRDGSSRFGEKNRFGNFGAIGAAWEFYKEGFIDKTLPWLSYGKLRGSYGITGSDNMGDYQYRDTYKHVLIRQGSLSKGGLIPSKLHNPYYQWEKNTKFELTLDIGIWEDRLLMSTTWYRERSGNQLVGLQLPAITGFSSVQGNLNATVQNRGWEFNLQTKPIQTPDLNWNSSINLTLPKNKLIAFPDLESSSYASRYVIGKPLGVQKFFHYTGVDPESGKYTFEDVNEDGVLNNDDKVVITDFSRKFYGGWNNYLQYKNWTFSFLFEFVKQKGSSGITAFGRHGNMSNTPVQFENRWRSKDNQGKYQRATSSYNDEYYDYLDSEAIIVNADFVRLKSLAIQYSFSKNWLKALSINRAVIYSKAQNLFTLTPYKGIDPQNPGSVNIPALTSFNVGIKLTL